MSFNPVMALLTQAVLPRCGDAPAVLEFGNQTFTVDAGTLNHVIARASAAGRDVAALRGINALDMTARGDRVAAFYAGLGARCYTAIDVNDTYGSLDGGALFASREVLPANMPLNRRRSRWRRGAARPRVTRHPKR